MAVPAKLQCKNWRNSSDKAIAGPESHSPRGTRIRAAATPECSSPEPKAGTESQHTSGEILNTNPQLRVEPLGEASPCRHCRIAATQNLGHSKNDRHPRNDREVTAQDRRGQARPHKPRRATESWQPCWDSSDSVERLA